MRPNTNEKSLNMNDIRRICFYDLLLNTRWDELDSATQRKSMKHETRLKYNDTILKLLDSSFTAFTPKVVIEFILLF